MSQKIITSAIPSMSVAAVRRCVSEIRERARLNSPENLFYPSCPLNCDKYMTAEEFALKFEIGHHHKRHIKHVQSNIKNS